ncbi:MAG: hypothetical protein JWM40_1890 [Frankiales bacterium]|nr:hypothetical protein [Frankiales bacterium]
MTLVPAVSRVDAAAQAVQEGRTLVALLERLSPAQWDAPTECPPWSVRDMVTHVLANHEGLASVREQLHQLIAGRKRGGSIVDGISAVQLDDRRTKTPADLLGAYQGVVTASVRARKRWPGPLRGVRVSVPLGDHEERWSLAYLHDVIYTRDAWMHRMDICRAAGVEPSLDPAHDGAIVQRIVQEWADRHGQAFSLELTGPAGGTFAGAGSGDEVSLALDAVDFCRAVSGRDNPSGLLAVSVGY